MAGGLRHLFVSLWSLTSAARGLCVLTVMNGSTAPHSTALQVAGGDAVLFASMFTPGICRNSAWMSCYTQIHACLTELEEAMVGKRSQSWLQYRPPLQAKLHFKSL